MKTPDIRSSNDGSENTERRKLGVKRLAQGLGAYALGIGIGIAGERLNIPILEDAMIAISVGSGIRMIEGVVTLPVARPFVESVLHSMGPYDPGYQSLQQSMDRYLP